MDRTSALEKAIAAQNALAAQAPKPEPRRGVMVRVLVAGRYNGPNHKNDGPVAKDAIIEVAGGAYLDSLLADKYVTRQLTKRTRKPKAETGA